MTEAWQKRGPSNDDSEKQFSLIVISAMFYVGEFVKITHYLIIRNHLTGKLCFLIQLIIHRLRTKY
jgi:hypothetical protein